MTETQQALSAGYEALQATTAWIDLSSRGKIRVRGEDRHRLLHAMSTNHVQNLKPGDGLYTFFLNAQGRILADAYIYAFEDSLFLDTEALTAQKLFQHLDQYIIADDVELIDETSTSAAFGLEGPTSIEMAQKLGFDVPEQPNAARVTTEGFVARVSSTGAPAFRLFAPASARESILQQFLAAGIPQATEDEARTVRLEHGKPQYGNDISERYLVQETQQLNAIHFSKGCYLGQEIVERVRSRGQVHRLLTRVHIKTDAPPPNGTKLQFEGKDVAEITSSAYSPAQGQSVALAYVRREAITDKPILTVAGSEPIITAQVT